MATPGAAGYGFYVGLTEILGRKLRVSQDGTMRQRVEVMSAICGDDGGSKKRSRATALQKREAPFATGPLLQKWIIEQEWWEQAAQLSFV